MTKFSRFLRYVFFTFFALVGIAILYLSCKIGGNIPFSKQWPLYEALRNTAAIIFAVVGAWLAIIYPDRLKFSFGEESSESKKTDSPSKLKLLFIPAVHSTVILVILLLVGIIAPIAKEFDLFKNHIEISRRISFVLLTLLTLYQAVIVVLAILPAGFLAHTAAKEAVQAKQASIFDRAKEKSRRRRASQE